MKIEVKYMNRLQQDSIQRCSPDQYANMLSTKNNIKMKTDNSAPLDSIDKMAAKDASEMLQSRPKESLHQPVVFFRVVGKYAFTVISLPIYMTLYALPKWIAKEAVKILYVAYLPIKKFLSELFTKINAFCNDKLQLISLKFKQFYQKLIDPLAKILESLRLSAQRLKQYFQAPLRAVSQFLLRFKGIKFDLSFIKGVFEKSLTFWKSLFSKKFLPNFSFKKFSWPKLSLKFLAKAKLNLELPFSLACLKVDKLADLLNKIWQFIVRKAQQLLSLASKLKNRLPNFNLPSFSLKPVVNFFDSLGASIEVKIAKFTSFSPKSSCLKLLKKASFGIPSKFLQKPLTHVLSIYKFSWLNLLKLHHSAVKAVAKNFHKVDLTYKKLAETSRGFIARWFLKGQQGLRFSIQAGKNLCYYSLVAMMMFLIIMELGVRQAMDVSDAFLKKFSRS